MLNQGNNFFLIIVGILITYFLDNEWILLGEVTGQSPLGVKGLTILGWLYYIYIYPRRLLEF